MTKVFAKALMASEDVQSYVGSCRYYDDSEYAVVDDGAVVNIGDLDYDHVYSVTSLDWNVHQATAPVTGKLTREDICIVDLADVPSGLIGGNTYKIGTKITDLKLQAGYTARFRRLFKGDKFWLGAGNFAAAPTVGQYSTVANGSTLFTASTASAAANQLNIKILDAKVLTQGQTVYGAPNYEQLYLCEVQ